MRVIGGEARGRPLVAPVIAGLRPTSDRVREAIFDILQARELVEGFSVLDLFCGSGALGIEALSRGARSCSFVDKEGRALEAVRANLERTGLASRVTELVRSDASAYLAGTRAHDLSLVDPPYSFEGWPELLERLSSRVAVLEHRAAVQIPEKWQTIRSYRYGGTLVTLLSQQVRDEDTV